MDATIRLAAGAALIAAGALAGRALSQSMRRRVERLDELSEATRALRQQMLSLKKPLAEALSGAGGPLFEAVCQELEAEETPKEAWEGAWKRLRARGGGFDCLDALDERALAPIYASLGEGGSARQAARLDEADEALERLRKKARAALDERGRLYASLGALSGLAAAVLLY